MLSIMFVGDRLDTILEGAALLARLNDIGRTLKLHYLNTFDSLDFIFFVLGNYFLLTFDARHSISRYSQES